MIDFHAHILPEIDDGATDVNVSLDMLRFSVANGVDTVVSTSHCYVTTDESITAFLDKRERSYNKLMDAIKADGGIFPKIVLGSEVHLMQDIAAFPSLSKLCIGDTNYILIEMPYVKWNMVLFDSLYYMQLHGLRPIMAHIERFLSQEKQFVNLFGMDLIYQVNAESVFRGPFRRRIPWLFEKNAIHILGTDMHNMTNRCTKLSDAYDYIEKHYGEQQKMYLQKNSEKILNNESIKSKSFPPLSFLDKLKL